MNDDTNNDQATERQVMEYIPDRKPRTYRVSAGVAAVIVAITLAVGIVVGLALPAGAQTNPDQNKPEYWGEDCFKIDEGPGGASWTADADYRLVVLKSANVNDTFPDVKKGDVLTTVSGKDISHMILCPPVPPTTTTTTQPEQSTTTTQPEQSTTTTQPEQSTTTTLPEQSTTSTSHPGEASTTTQPEETTTTTVPVPPVTDTPDELPFTGAETLYMALAGFAALVVGGGALVAVRRTE